MHYTTLVENKNSYKIWYVVLFLIISVVVLWNKAFAVDNNYLRVVALNIGQGDSFYVEAPNGKQMIIDGGPDKKILSELSAVMPYGDDSIDVLMITNPDKDHMAGFLDVMEKYKVGMVLEPGTVNDSMIYKNIEKMIAEKNIPDLVARKGMKVILDKEKNVYFEVIFPDRDVHNWTTNDGSIVGKIFYGNTSFMMTGDATIKTEGVILANNSDKYLKSDVLKAGHHGSRTSSGEAFVSVVRPSMAMISAGVNNSYGHPHQETLDTLNKFGVKILGTYDVGRFEIDSDGQKVWQK